MKRRTWTAGLAMLLVLLVGVLLCAPVAFAQGCPADANAVVVNPLKVRMDQPEHDRIMLDGAPSVTGYLLGWYVDGASVPVSQAPIAKAAFTLVPGTTTCYEAPLPTLGIPIGQKYLAVLKTLRGPEESAWSGPSNPFGFETPAMPPGLVRVKK